MDLVVILKHVLKYFIGIGCLSHVLNFFLEAFTLRGNTSYWLFLLFSSLIGLIYMLVKFDLLSNKSYQKLKGIKLQCYKLFLLLLLFFSSMIVFGGYLNNAALGLNYLLRKDKLGVEKFEVLEIKRPKASSKKRKGRRLPALVISNKALVDNIKLSGIEFDELKEEIEYVEIEWKEGYLGWGIIEKIIVD